MFFLGCISLLQMCLLPGLVAFSFLKIRLRLIPSIASVIGLSLILNYLLVLLLIVLRIYYTWVLLLIVVLEVGFLLWRYRLPLQKTAWVSLEAAWQSITGALKDLFTSDPNNPKQHEDLLHRLVLLISAFLALAAVTHLSARFLSEIGTVFNGWDSVVSWNPWAVSWADGVIPQVKNNLYPHLIPANWSLTYVLIQNTQIQLFAKSIMPLFPLLILLLLFDFGFQKKSSGPFFGVFFTYLLFVHFLGEEISNGYADIALAFFAFLSIYLLLQVDTNQEFERTKRLVIGSIIFAAGAAVTKQAGVFLLAVCPFLCYAMVVQSVKKEDRKQFVRWLAFGLLAAFIIAGPWYIYKGIGVLTGAGTGLEYVANVSAKASGQSSSIAHILTQVRSLGKYLVFFVLLIPAFFLLGKSYRLVILLIILPITVLWAYFASYDFRNLSLMLPLLGLTIGLLFERIGNFMVKLLTNLRFEKWSNLLWVVLVIVILVGISFVFTTENLTEKQISEQKQIFDPEKNALLYELIPDFELGVKVLTNYPVDKLPGFENNQTNFWFDDYADFLEAISEDENIKLVFAPSYAAPEIMDYLQNGVESGLTKLIFESKTWIPYTMYQLLR